MKQETWDLIVVGCGAGGVATAVSHLECRPGSRVLVLERAPRAARGGNTSWTGSFFRLDPDGAPAPDFVQRMHDLSRGESDPAVIAKLADVAQPTIQWLQDLGVEMAARTTYFLTSKGPRLMPAAGGVSIVDRLITVLEQAGGVMRYDTVALRLEADGDRVVGIHVDGADGPVLLRAANVVLACGGFEGSPELLAKHLGERGRELPTITPGGRANRGEGIEMAVAVGAGLAGQFDRFHGEPVDPRSREGEALVMVYPYGILVDSDGQRFLDEGADTPDNTFESVAYQIWDRADQHAYVIADQKLIQAPDVQRAVLTEVKHEQADSLPALAARLAIDAEALVATVQAYNIAAVPGPLDVANADGVATTGLTPPKSNWARPIDEPPFVAWPVTCAITFTFGGLATDDRARVLSDSGVPIPGLYAVGEIAGLYYHSYPGATSVLRALCFGKIAGRETAVG